MKVGILGATGHTGQKLARRLHEQGQELLLAGRNPDKLSDLRVFGETLVASATDSASLEPLFEASELVINCAGPYTELGWPSVQLALEKRTDLWDLTGEQGFQRRCIQLDGALREAGTVVANAMGLEVLVSDCGAALLAEEHGAVQRVDIVNTVRDFGPSQGSFGSVLHILGTDCVAWRDGREQPARVGKPWRRVEGHHHIWGPGVDILTVARSTGAATVEVWFDAPGWFAAGARATSRSNKALFASPLGGVLRKALSKAPLPSADNPGPWSIQVSVSGQDRTISRTWTGSDPYGITAEITAWAAVERLQRGNRLGRGGLLSPSQVVDPARFFEHLHPLVREQP